MNQEYVCQQCKSGFTALARTGPRVPKYCSRTCGNLARNKQVERTCPQCGKLFKVFRYLQNIQKHCSQTCAGVLSRTRVEKECRNCGKRFFKAASQFNYFKGAGRYCSRPCVRAGLAKIAVDKPISDRYGRTKRKADKEWKREVRERDQFTCQRCGKVDPYIHAHHVATRARRPDLKHDVSNGKCLCGSCHQWVHWNPVESTALGLLSDATYERARKPICKFCEETSQAHGLCAKHYSRLRRHGDPLLTYKPGRHVAGSQPLRELTSNFGN